MCEENDSTLIARAQEDPQAFGVLYERYVGRIYSYICYRTGNNQDAEDLTARTFYRALNHFPGYEDRCAPFSAWLYRIAHNLAMDHYRCQPARAASSDDISENMPSESNPAKETEQELAIEEVRAALWQLPPEQRQVVVLKFLQGFSNEEIASTLEKSIGAVKAQQHRAIGALRRILLSEPETSEVER